MQVLPFSDRAIPQLQGIDGRESVSIRDCGEPLVPLSSLDPAKIRILPEYYLRGYRAANIELFLRAGAAERLRTAAASLPENHRLMILDAWRPLELQRELFDEYRDRLRTQHTDFDATALDMETRKYVSYPSNDLARPSPHLTGGAVDLAICSREGRILNMGTAFDAFGVLAGTRHFEEKLREGATLSEGDAAALSNRRTLFHIMTEAGFTNYREEWWHFDYGNQFWGRITDREAIYGATSVDVRI